MKYEITIRQLEEFTEEEKKKLCEDSRSTYFNPDRAAFSDKPYHEIRVLHAEVTQEEFQAVKKAIIGVLS